MSGSGEKGGGSGGGNGGGGHEEEGVAGVGSMDNGTGAGGGDGNEQQLAYDFQPPTPKPKKTLYTVKFAKLAGAFVDRLVDDRPLLAELPYESLQLLSEAAHEALEQRASSDFRSVQVYYLEPVADANGDGAGMIVEAEAEGAGGGGGDDGGPGSPPAAAVAAPAPAAAAAGTESPPPVCGACGSYMYIDPAAKVYHCERKRDPGCRGFVHEKPDSPSASSDASGAGALLTSCLRAPCGCCRTATYCSAFSLSFDFVSSQY